jgi:hypothetical protein
VGEALDAVREVRVAHRVSLARDPAVDAVAGSRLLGGEGDRAEHVPQQRLCVVDRDALAGVADRRRGELGQRHAPEPLRRLGDPRGHAVDAARRRTDVEDLDGIAEVDHHGVQRRALAVAGRGDHEVQQHRLAARRRHEHVAARAEPRQQRLRHERRHQRGQRRIDRVASGAQDLRAGGGGQGVTGRDDAAFSHPLRPPI